MHFNVGLYGTPLVSASVFYKDFADISCENSHAHIRRLNAAAAYLFLNYSQTCL